MDFLDDIATPTSSGQQNDNRMVRGKVDAHETAVFRPLPTLGGLGLKDFAFRRKVHNFYGGKANKMNGIFPCPEDMGSPLGSCPHCNYRRDIIEPWLNRELGDVANHDGRVFERNMAARNRARAEDAKEGEGVKKAQDKIAQILLLAKPFNAQAEFHAPAVKRNTDALCWLKISRGGKGLQTHVVSAILGMIGDVPELNNMYTGVTPYTTEGDKGICKNWAGIDLKDRWAVMARDNFLIDLTLDKDIGFDWKLSHPGGEPTSWHAMVNLMTPKPLLDGNNEALKASVTDFINELKALTIEQRKNYLYIIDPPRPLDYQQKMADAWLAATGCANASANTSTSVSVPAAQTPAAAAPIPAPEDELGF